MTYLADLIKNEVGEVKIKNFIIYDVTLPLFEDIYYTDSELEEDFLKLMKMFSCDSKKEIEKMLKEGASVDFTMKVNGLSREKLEDSIKK